MCILLEQIRQRYINCHPTEVYMYVVCCFKKYMCLELRKVLRRITANDIASERMGLSARVSAAKRCFWWIFFIRLHIYKGLKATLDMFFYEKRKNLS